MNQNAKITGSSHLWKVTTSASNAIHASLKAKASVYGCLNIWNILWNIHPGRLRWNPKTTEL